MFKSLRRTLVAAVLTVLLLSLLFAMVPAIAAETYTWYVQDSSTKSDPLHSISGVDANHVWAVGGEDGTIIFYNGSKWTTQYTQPGAHYYDVYALDRNNVWAVGYDGLISYFNGSNWTDQSIDETMVFDGVYAADAEHVWAVGGYGSIYFYDGVIWQEQYTSTTIRAFNDVSGTDKDHVWAVGFPGSITFFNGTNWTETMTGGYNLFGISVLDTKHIWATGGGGEIRFFNGSKWSVQKSGTDEILMSVSACSANRAYAVSDGSTILAFNGSSWTNEYTETDITGALFGVFALDENHAWACGSSGLMLARQPSNPEPKPEPTTATSRTWGHDSIGVQEPSESWYLAEGCTGTGFETWVLVQNPNDTAADVALTYMTDRGPENGPSETLPANSRKTYDVSATVPDTWNVSTMVQSNVPVIAERAMYGNGRAWGHDSIGVSEPSKTWYLAEGSTGAGFETWVLVQNPNDQTSKVILTYMTPSGPKEGPEAALPPNSRMSFNVADAVANEYEVSTTVESDLPVVAERAMYGPGRTWGHDSIGVSSPQSHWFLAEGCTGTGFETWVLVQNPTSKQAQVGLTYMTAEGQVDGPVVDIPPYSRHTFDVSKDVPDNYSVSTMVSANAGVIAERAMYGNGRAWGHDSIGTGGANYNWYLAEGSTAKGFETWVLIQNPNDLDVRVVLTFMTSEGKEQGPIVTVPAMSRVTVNVGAYVSDTWEVSTLVSSTYPVIAERAMYGDPK